MAKIGCWLGDGASGCEGSGSSENIGFCTLAV
jgi:hypothetical protein